MIQRNIPFEQIAPWLVSGASGCYIVARARQLSRSKANRAPLIRFLAKQSDLILALCGGPAIWHIARRRAAAHRRRSLVGGDRQRTIAGAVHQLRQVFTVLLLGLGMIARRANDSSIANLARRLQDTARAGAGLLSVLDEPIAAELRTSSLLEQHAQQASH